MNAVESCSLELVLSDCHPIFVQFLFNFHAISDSKSDDVRPDVKLPHRDWQGNGGAICALLRHALPDTNIIRLQGRGRLARQPGVTLLYVVELIRIKHQIIPVD